jgi:hypothetical protein
MVQMFQKIEELQRMTMEVVAHLQLQFSETLIAQVKTLSVEIVDCLSGKLLRKMEYPFVHATQLYRMI